ncbi:MAG: patatin-like phospholipase family protein [Bacteroidetes bacterium]|nr:patatin-like phospholipase family protein [Bacteroidota bacterium]
MKKACILSIDGGGIRGILPGIILSYIENKIIEETGFSDAKIADYFDLVAGTSTGGILACCLLKNDGKGNNRPQYSAKDAVELYTKFGGKIFDISFYRKLFNPFYIFKYKYSAKALEKLLNKYLGDDTLSTMVIECMITAYDIEKRETKFFSKKDASHNHLKDYYIKDICRATSAAPTYFKPAKIKSLYGNSIALIDGGVFANNPAMCAYIEAMKTDFSNTTDKPAYPEIENIIIVSIGTGGAKKPYHYTDMDDDGVIGWAMPIVDILMSGNAETMSYMLNKIYNDTPHHYFRLDPALIDANDKMDDASDSNIENLINDAKTYVTANQALLDKIVKLLIDNNKNQNSSSRKAITE